MIALLLLLAGCSPEALDLGHRDRDASDAETDRAIEDASSDADAGDADAGDADVGRRVVALTLGDRHGCGRWDSGEAACWGGSDYAQASDAYQTEGQLCERCVMPRHEFDETNLTAVAAGGAHTCFVRGGRLACFGRNDLGQLGRDIADANPHPEIRDVPLDDVTAVALGRAHSCAIAGGRVYCFGLGDRRQLGVDPASLDTCPVPPDLAGADGFPATGEVACSLVPIMVPGIEGATALVAGPHTTCARTTDSVVCFGDTAPLPLPPSGAIAPTSIPAFATARSFAIGAAHGCLVDGTGATRCFGAHGRGQLGVGDALPTSADCDATRCHEPVIIQTLDPALDVVVGDGFSCARLESHAVYCWGDASLGRLGISSFDALPLCDAVPCARTPRPVYMLEDALLLEAGDAFACALREHAQLVVCWGANGDAQCKAYRNADSATAEIPSDFGF